MPDRQTINNELKDPRMPYSVPEGYFEGLAEQVLARIRQEEAKEELGTLSPLLQQLSKKQPYSTPVGYFDFPVNLPASEQAPVRSLFSRTWIRYAVAASVIAAGIFLWMGRAEQPTGNAKNVIIEVKQDIQQLNEKEESLLQEFVSAGMTGQETAQIDIQERAADKTLLADVSEQELNEFLEQSEFITSTETNE
jgi:hypothetical protein